MSALPRAVLFGAATGGRSQLPAAALARSAASDGGPVTRFLARRWVRSALVLGAAGELVGDKLPNTPSRLQPPGLGFRVLIAAVGAVAIAEREDASPWLVGAAGAAAAVASSFGGAKWRAFAATRFGRDLPGALAEDALVAAASVVSVRGL